MKKVPFVLILTLILVLAVFSAGMAALPGTGWWSALWVQNISDTPGAVSMEAYGMDGSAPVDSDVFDFDPVKSLVYDPGIARNYPDGNVIGFQSSLPKGFEGSVVLSSSVPAASVSQIANYKNGSLGGSGTATAMYQGISSEILSDTLLAPTIKHNYSSATTTLYIQAAGADADVTVEYVMADGGTYTDSATIEANRSYLFDPVAAGVPASNCGFDTMVSPCFGSATISASTPIAGVLLEHPHSGTPVTYVQAIRLSTPADISTKIYVPAIKNEFCGSTGCGTAGAEVMNVGTEDALINITLTISKLGSNASKKIKVGDVYTDTAVIPAGENYNFSKWNNNLGGLPAGTMAAAVIESTNGQPLVGASNDTKIQPKYPTTVKIKYSLFSDDLATPWAYVPMVKEFYGIFTGGVDVQNVGDNPDYINIEYHAYGSDEVCTLKTKNMIPAGGAAETHWVSRVGSDVFTLSGDCTNFGWLVGKQFSVRAYTDGGENIVMMATENTPGSSLDISRYEGVNLPGFD